MNDNDYNTPEDEFTHEGDDDSYLDEQHDAMLERQEMEDFAQDGYFENMEPCGDGMWG